MKGIPLRLEVGPKDIENKQVVLVRRDTGEKMVVATEQLKSHIVKVLEDIQLQLFEKAKQNRQQKTYTAKSFAEFKEIFQVKTGLVKAMWCGDRSCEDKIKEETGATSRCIPFEQNQLQKTCVVCEKEAKQLVFWAKAY